MARQSERAPKPEGDRQAVSTSSEHGRITVFVPETLKRWCKVEAIQNDETLSDLVERAIQEYKQRHSK